MSGLRITHPTERSCTFTLIDGSRAYPRPIACLVCGRMHELKTYHITLDAEGAAIVSTEVWQRVSVIPGQPFRLRNEVAAPPPLILELGGMTRPRVVAHQE